GGRELQGLCVPRLIDAKTQLMLLTRRFAELATKMTEVSDSVRLRPCQHAALERFLSDHHREFLAAATPGAGKTTLVLVAARVALASSGGCGHAHCASENAVGAGRCAAAAAFR